MTVTPSKRGAKRRPGQALWKKTGEFQRKVGAQGGHDVPGPPAGLFVLKGLFDDFRSECSRVGASATATAKVEERADDWCRVLLGPA